MSIKEKLDICKELNVKPKQVGRNVRMTYSKIDEILEMPNLLEVQKNSFKWLIDKGIDEVLNDVSPIVDFQGKYVVEFVGFTLDDAPKYSVEECKAREVNYAVPFHVKVRLTSKETGEMQEHDIYMGDLPVMTDVGTFIINGAERAVVSQLVRSPGMYYAAALDKSGKGILTSQVIPYRGAWLESETDMNDVFYIKIDKNRKIPVTVLIRALDERYSTAAGVMELFGDDIKIKNTLEKDGMQAEAEKNGTSAYEESLKEIYRKLRPGDPATSESALSLLHNMFFDPKRYDIGAVGRYKFDKKCALGTRLAGHKLSRSVASPITGEVLFEAGTLLSLDDAKKIENAGVMVAYVDIGEGKECKVFSNGMVDPLAVYGIDLKSVGINEKCRSDMLAKMLEEAEGDVEKVKKMAKDQAAELSPHHITKDDIYASINYLICLSHEIGTADDIDHLGNRRIRAVGELIQNQLRIGFSRMDKSIKERISTQDAGDLTPQSIINIRPVTAAIREFFGSSPLSSFLDQNNPLAELTHKRRLSALGPGGLSRDRASFDVRDVHYTHYGRICPIETPEGPNIGLISYLASYAKINPYGFIETPYRKIDKVNCKVTNEVEYMTADVEDNYIIAQANEPLDSEGRFMNKKVTARKRKEFVQVPPSQADYIDVSPKMVISVATGFIPFLENDDNARALMGSNMQKQAVPLMTTESPIVGTGMEYKVGTDCGVNITAKESGFVKRVDARSICIKRDNGFEDVYELVKYKRSNQSTCINQRPIVSVGERIEKGDIIADGPASSYGEISLGKNALIGFMTWEGYNYEDAVLLNEKLVRNDTYTSIHIEEFTTDARQTKLGDEEITNDIPNCNNSLKDLDEHGIVRIGTEVRPGDILVGKLTPKGETELTPEERLLRAIFGEKAREVRDTSLRVKNGEYGIVIDVRVFTRENGDELAPGVNESVKVYIAQKRKISVGDKMAGRHGNKGVVSRILPPEDMPFMEDGTPLDIVLNPLGVPSRMNIGQVLEVHLGIAAKTLGMKIETPAFDGAKEKDIIAAMKLAGLYREAVPNEDLTGKTLYEEVVSDDGEKKYVELTPEKMADSAWIKAMIAEKKIKVLDGKRILYDGRTGERFDNPVTVGIMYYLKLHHLVDDKIHARSIGPYSLITQQPLGGKAQFGGQRFGEMEVWALEAYGAAYTLQEILTVKSDDVTGRIKAYEAIVKGQNIPQSGIPESFRVLVKELQALALDITVLDKDGNEVELPKLSDEEAEMMPKFVAAPEDLEKGEMTNEGGFSIRDADKMDDDGIVDAEGEDADSEDVLDDDFDDDAFDKFADNENLDDGNGADDME